MSSVKILTCAPTYLVPSFSTPEYFFVKLDGSSILIHGGVARVILLARISHLNFKSSPVDSYTASKRARSANLRLFGRIIIFPLSDCFAVIRDVYSFILVFNRSRGVIIPALKVREVNTDLKVFLGL